MNKKAQFELSPGGLLMGGAGAIFAWIMASRMDTGIVYKILTTIITGAVCYFIAWFILNK